jgi:hypothetical protein
LHAIPPWRCGYKAFLASRRAIETWSGLVTGASNDDRRIATYSEIGIQFRLHAALDDGFLVSVDGSNPEVPGCSGRLTGCGLADQPMIPLPGMHANLAQSVKSDYLYHSVVMRICVRLNRARTSSTTIGNYIRSSPAQNRPRSAGMTNREKSIPSAFIGDGSRET